MIQAVINLRQYYKWGSYYIVNFIEFIVKHSFIILYFTYCLIEPDMKLRLNLYFEIMIIVTIKIRDKFNERNKFRNYHFVIKKDQNIVNSKL